MKVDIEHIIAELEEKHSTNRPLTPSTLKHILFNSLERQTKAEKEFERQRNEAMNDIAHDM